MVDGENGSGNGNEIGDCLKYFNKKLKKKKIGFIFGL